MDASGVSSRHDQHQAIGPVGHGLQPQGRRKVREDARGKHRSSKSTAAYSQRIGSAHLPHWEQSGPRYVASTCSKTVIV
jgi:hypothetical protein